MPLNRLQSRGGDSFADCSSAPQPEARECRLRHSLRAKRLRLLVKPDGIELVIPRGVSEQEALSFYTRHRSWAIATLDTVRQRADALQKPLIDGGTLPFRGELLPFRQRESENAQTSMRFCPVQGFLLERAAGRMLEEAQLRKVLFDCLSPRIRVCAEEAVARLGAEFDLVPRAIRIKRMRTRWGSCGPRGDVNLNWILAFAPPDVMDYVVFHELCHLRHRDHSARFWSLVSAGVPDWQHHRAWLRVEGPQLLARFG